MSQTFFDYNLVNNLAIEDFYVNESNKNAYDFLFHNKKFNNKVLLNGPSKCGKSHLGLIWKKKFKALEFKNNLEDLLSSKKNIIIDHLELNKNEESLFHIINHCSLNNLKLLIILKKPLNQYFFKLSDLSSRLKSFNLIIIGLPNDDMIIKLLQKLFHEKQIIINNPEIFDFILKRIERSYEVIFSLVKNIDKLSLEKKRQLTIPLLKELI